MIFKIYDHWIYKGCRILLVIVLAASALLLMGLALGMQQPQDVKAQSPIYVDEDATGNADGTSWTDAYTNVQDALAVAVAGEDIWVAEGICRPSEHRGTLT